MKLLLVNTVALGGSIGRHLRDVALEAQKRGMEVLLAYGRGPAPDFCRSIKIGSAFDHAVHGLATRLCDAHAFASRRATMRFADAVDAFKPDIVSLHNIHGYYLNIQVLMTRLAPYRTFLTLHDAWPLTGHCPFFDTYRCSRWQQQCGHCPATGDYPSSKVDRSERNKRLKTEAFKSHPHLTLISVSRWLDDIAEASSLAELPRVQIPLDVDLHFYSPVVEAPARPTVLGAAAVWDSRKYPEFFERLRFELPDDVEIRLAGRLRRPIPGVTILGRQSPGQMACEYGRATVFVNPTLADNYPMSNREALACGTPVVSRNVGGSVEDIVDAGGAVAACSDDDELIAATRRMLAGESSLRRAARLTAERLYAGRPGIKALFDVFC